MFTVYIIRSLSKKYNYTGLTNNLNRRFNEHNRGYNKTTKHYLPYEVIYSKQFETRIDARKHEKYLKSGVGRAFIKDLGI